MRSSQLPHGATLETRLTNFYAWFSAAPLGYPGDQTHKPPLCFSAAPRDYPEDLTHKPPCVVLTHWATLEIRLTNLYAWFSAAPLCYPGDQTHKPLCMVLSFPTVLPRRPDSQTSMRGSQLPHWATLETRLTNFYAWFSAAPLGYPGDQTHKPLCVVLSFPTGNPRNKG
ncbi:hypothetical protein BgiMline_001067 [Biomphalaria glabrata]